jgi:hypothetical protein
MCDQIMLSVLRDQITKRPLNALNPVRVTWGCGTDLTDLSINYAKLNRYYNQTSNRLACLIIIMIKFCIVDTEVRAVRSDPLPQFDQITTRPNSTRSIYDETSLYFTLTTELDRFWTNTNWYVSSRSPLTIRAHLESIRNDQAILDRIGPHKVSKTTMKKLKTPWQILELVLSCQNKIYSIIILFLNQKNSSPKNQLLTLTLEKNWKNSSENNFFFKIDQDQGQTCFCAYCAIFGVFLKK